MRALGAILVVFVAFGCGGYASSVSTKESPGWIKFVGNTSGIEVSVDNGSRWTPNREVDRYELSPGKHEIRIYRGGQLTLQRILIVTEGIESEITIP